MEKITFNVMDKMRYTPEDQNKNHLEVFLVPMPRRDWQRCSRSRGDASMGEYRGGRTRLP